MAKSLSARQVIEIRHRSIELQGEWGRCLGTIDRHGVVFVWGNSGNGKTTAVVSLCKELSRFGRVLYVSLEEGFSMSFQNTLRRLGVQESGNRFQVVERATLEEIDERLSKPKSPEFIVIDSFQYLQMSYKRYIAFREAHGNKLIIFVSHADGKQPAGRAAKSVKYDAMLKIWVEGYKAFSKGRFIGETGEAVIWDKGADEYWCKEKTSAESKTKIEHEDETDGDE